MMRLNRVFLVAVAVAGLGVVPHAMGQTAKAPSSDTKAGTSVKTSAAAGVNTTGGAGGASASASAGTGGAAGPTTTAPTTTSTAPATTAAPTGSSPTGTTATTTPPAAGAAKTSPTSSTASAQGQPLDGSTYVVRLRDLEQRIDELKEQIRRSHTRLSLLSDTILSGGVGGARAEIAFRNDLSSAFRLTGAVFVLDGVVQYNKQDDSEAGLLASQKEIPIFSGSIPPGDHTLQVVVRLRGYGYGVFSYLRGYKFEVKSSHSFTVTEGKTVSLQTIAWEKGDVTTPLEQRPTIRYTENLRTGVVEGAAPGAATPSAPKSTPAKSAPSSTAPAAGANISGGASIGTGGK